MNKYGDRQKATIDSFDIRLFANKRGSCEVIVTRAEYDKNGRTCLYSEAVYENVSGFTIARILNACPINREHLARVDAERLLSAMGGGE